MIYKAKTKGADSCLLEVCFIDDADDMKIYARNKDNIAKAIAVGIAKTYSLKKVESKKDNNKNCIFAFFVLIIEIMQFDINY